MDGDNQEKRVESPITDPAVLTAIDFLNGYWGRMGRRAPAAGSPEEQSAILVLAAYIRSLPQPPSVQGGDVAEDVDRIEKVIQDELYRQSFGDKPPASHSWRLPISMAAIRRLAVAIVAAQPNSPGRPSTEAELREHAPRYFRKH